MKLEDLRRYQSAADSPGDTGLQHTDGQHVMVVAKEDMRWFLKCAALIEEIEIKSSALVR